MRCQAPAGMSPVSRGTAHNLPEHSHRKQDRVVLMASVAAAEALRKHPWQTSIISADAGRIVLAAGRASGLQVGDRLVVYDGNRRIVGESGTYVLPGMKIAEVDIQQVDEHRSNAVVLQNGSVEAGDVAMPIGRNP